MIKFCGPKHQAPKGTKIVNVTSISKDYGRGFSPMIHNHSPLNLYGFDIWTVENGWQYSRKWPGQNSQEEWDKWRRAGYANKSGVRYPLGKGVVPEFSFITPELGKMGIVEARKKIYLPLYFQKLERFCWNEIKTMISSLRNNEDVWIWDFDVYGEHKGSFETLLNDVNISLGHGFLIAEYLSQMTGIDFFAENYADVLREKEK